MIMIDMEMPKNCMKCPFENYNFMLGTNSACRITGKRTTGIREAIREEHCPLNEITEAEKDPLKVGDVIFNDGDFGIVTWIDDNNIIVMWDNGSSGDYNFDEVERTPWHLDEVENILERLKELEERRNDFVKA